MVHVLFTVNIFCLSAPMVVVLTFFHKLFFLTCVAKNLHKYLPHCFLLSIQKVLPMSSFLCYSNPQWGMDFKIILCETAFFDQLPGCFWNYYARKESLHVLRDNRAQCQAHTCFLVSDGAFVLVLPADRPACSFSSSCRHLQLHHEVYCPGLRPWHWGPSRRGVWWWVCGESPLHTPTVTPLHHWVTSA